MAPEIDGAGLVEVQIPQPVSGGGRGRLPRWRPNPIATWLPLPITGRGSIEAQVQTIQGEGVVRLAIVGRGSVTAAVPESAGVGVLVDPFALARFEDAELAEVA